MFICQKTLSVLSLDCCEHMTERPARNKLVSDIKDHHKKQSGIEKIFVTVIHNKSNFTVPERPGHNKKQSDTKF